MLFRRFENLIDVFKPSPDVAPPAGMLRFYAHYLKQVWPLMTAVLVVGFFASLIEVALFSFLGQLIDMAQATDDARTFFAEHRNALLWMAAVALVIRPLVFGLHNLLTHQAINPGLTNLIRWQNHRYVLKQSLSFFQNDFAGRIAQRVMQTGPSLRDSAMQVIDALWHVVVYAGSALYLFAAADLRRDQAGLGDWLQAIVSQLEEPQRATQLPLDLRGTAFQQRVWQALQQIPAGETRRYGELAATLGSHARAVARACASNPIGLLVPCHRVVGSQNALTGYRWGLARKARLLDREGQGESGA